MVIDLINNAPSTAYSKDNQGNSVLHIAAEMGNMALVKSLVQMHNFGLLTCTRFVMQLASVDSSKILTGANAWLIITQSHDDLKHYDIL